LNHNTARHFRWIDPLSITSEATTPVNEPGTFPTLAKRSIHLIRYTRPSYFWDSFSNSLESQHRPTSPMDWRIVNHFRGDHVGFKLNLIGVSVWQFSLTLASAINVIDKNVIDIIFICVCIWCLNQKNYFTDMRQHVFHVERSDFDMEWPGRTTDLQLGNRHNPPQTVLMVGFKSETPFLIVYKWNN
jgi:hypothetical protein